MSGSPSASYLAAHRYDHDRVEIDTREALFPLPIQRRDLAIVRDVWRYKLLATAQLHELWWPGRTQRAAQKRLTRLFQGGLLERFRPVTRRGSYPWIYQLGPEGHRTLQRAGLMAPRQRYERRDVYDYTYVLHDLHLNSWVLAYRRLLKGALLDWDGETVIDPPTAARNAQLRLEDDWSAEDLIAHRPRTIAPDAMLEIARHDRDGSRLFLIEYDRTTRVDKNYEKFRRYDCFLTWWWRHSPIESRPLMACGVSSCHLKNHSYAGNSRRKAVCWAAWTTFYGTEGHRFESCRARSVRPRQSSTPTRCSVAKGRSTRGVRPARWRLSECVA